MFLVESIYNKIARLMSRHIVFFTTDMLTRAVNIASLISNQKRKTKNQPGNLPVINRALRLSRICSG